MQDIDLIIRILAEERRAATLIPPVLECFGLRGTWALPTTDSRSSGNPDPVVGVCERHGQRGATVRFESLPG